jgi:hypothetical protein
MDTGFSENDIEKLQKNLMQNIPQCVMERVLVAFMGVKIPLDANEEWVVKRLSEKIIAKGSIMPAY